MFSALVLGGSVAGLLAARVLSEYADEVVVVEPDDVESDATARDRYARRRGVPQGAQSHVFLDAGVRVLERMFPGFKSEVVADGGILASAGDTHCYVDGRLKVPVTGVEIISATRPFLEGQVRRRVFEIKNVRRVRGRACGLIFSGGRVSGAHAVLDGAADEVPLTADLVVDATGRGSRLHQWLEDAGWPAPPTQRMHVALGYATASFEAEPEESGPLVVLSLSGMSGARPRLVTLSRVEGDRWQLIAAGYGADKPGRGIDEFVERCRTDPASPVSGVAAGGAVIEDVRTFGHAENRRRDFDRLGRFPGGLFVVGDAVASFNPVYAQGMSAAALHAHALAEYLRSGASPYAPAGAYFKSLRAVVDAAWQSSSLNDLRMPHVTGKRPRGFGLTSRIGDLILRASIVDEITNQRFMEVVHMVAPPTQLVRPGALFRATRLGLRDLRRSG